MKLNASELIDAARQLEASGEAFYAAARPRLKGRWSRSLFRWLEAEEGRHEARFELLLEGLEHADGPWRRDEVYLAHMRLLVEGRIFPDAEAARALAARIQNDEEAVALALSFERGTIALFEGLREAVREEDRGVIDALIAEERTHVQALEALEGGARGTWSL